MKAAKDRPNDHVVPFGKLAASLPGEISQLERILWNSGVKILTCGFKALVPGDIGVRPARLDEHVSFVSRAGDRQLTR
jgi:hypothetical protein